MLPLETARAHRDAARKHRAQAREAVGTVAKAREWMGAHQRRLAVKALRRANPRGTG